ncbi:MAG: MFS transporter [Pseudomonadota bacterium]
MGRRERVKRERSVDDEGLLSTDTAASNKARMSLAACCAVHATQDGLNATLYVLLPILANAFGLSYAQVGVIRGLNNGAMMCLEIPSGVLAERVGERILLVFGLIAAGLGYLALANANGFVTVAVCLTVVGMGGAFQHALSASIVSSTFDGSAKTKALGTYNAVGDAGKLAFTGAFSLAVGIGIVWPSVVGGFGVIALVGALALFVVLRECNAGGRPDRTHLGHVDAIAGWGIRSRRGLGALLLIVFFDISVQAGFLTFLAFLLIEKDIPAALAGGAVVLTLAGGIFGKFGCGFLAARFGTLQSFGLVQCLTAAGIVAVLVAPTWAAFCLLPFVGVVLQGSSTITYGVVTEVFHSTRQSRGFALTYSVSSGASLVGPIVYGAIGDRFGLDAAMLTMGVLVLLTLPVALALGPALGDRARVGRE